ncbi:unnamed protein product, partial [Cyprideis torosa]
VNDSIGTAGSGGISSSDSLSVELASVSSNLARLVLASSLAASSLERGGVHCILVAVVQRSKRGEMQVVVVLERREVGTAVQFLANPRIAGGSEADKRNFLTRKGLREAEIHEAFRRSKQFATGTQQNYITPFLSPKPTKRQQTKDETTENLSRELHKTLLQLHNTLEEFN